MATRPSVFTGGLASKATASSNVGSYAITAGKCERRKQLHHQLRSVARLTISQTALIITADDKSMIY